MKLKERIMIITAVLLVPAWMYAEVNTGVNLNKTATYDYATQTGVIKLENYVGQVTKKENPNKSADVVLVVDGSESMNETVWGMDALYDAVGDFVDQLRTASLGSTAIEHRVALIVFAGNSELLCDFTSVEDQPVTYFQNLLKNACGTTTTGGVQHINYYNNRGTVTAYWGGTYGGTMAHMALGLASYVMTKDISIAEDAAELHLTKNRDWPRTWRFDPNTTQTTTYSNFVPKGARTGDNCNRYVVLMTDGGLYGVPRGADGAQLGLTSGTTGTWDYWNPEAGYNHNPGWVDYAENQAVAVATALKADENYSSTFYTIGFLSESEATNTLNNYLNNVSSNHLDPTDSNNPADYIPHDYYIRVDRTGGDMASIFANVSEEIVAGCAAVDLDEAEVKDIINGSDFKLPDGVDGTNLSTAVTVYKVPCTNYQQTSSGPVYSFDESSKTPVTVTLGLSKDANDNPIITVSGFDYTDNWCGLEYQSASKPKEPHGNKLVIEIPFTVNSYTEGLGEIETNVDGSGFFGTTTGGEDLGKLYGSPVVDLYELTIARSGLRAGESAIYRVTDKDGKLIYTIALTGTGSGSVSQKVLYVPDGDVTVTETGWGWANRPATAAITNTISKTNANPTYSFTLNSSGTSGKSHDDHKKNEFNK